MVTAFEDSDPEYASLMVTVVVAVHNLVGLTAMFTPNEEKVDIA